MNLRSLPHPAPRARAAGVPQPRPSGRYQEPEPFAIFVTESPLIESVGFALSLPPEWRRQVYVFPVLNISVPSGGGVQSPSPIAAARARWEARLAQRQRILAVLTRRPDGRNLPSPPTADDEGPGSDP
jgi:hypothetical protein